MGAWSPSVVKLLSWNLHSFVGRSGCCEPERIAALVDAVNPDIAVFQEVDFRSLSDTTIEIFKSDGRDHVIEAPAMGAGDRWYGQALISKYPISTGLVHDLSVSGREPRKLIDVILEIPENSLRVLATHLGLKRLERRQQVRHMRKHLGKKSEVPTIVTGDWNEWWPSDKIIRSLFGAGQNVATRRLRTFPAQFPIFGLDRAATRPAALLKTVTRVQLDPGASDHLPILVELNIPHS